MPTVHIDQVGILAVEPGIGGSTLRLNPLNIELPQVWCEYTANGISITVDVAEGKNHDEQLATIAVMMEAARIAQTLESTAPEWIADAIEESKDKLARLALTDEPEG